MYYTDHVFAEGIVMYYTPSHGGVKLSPERVKEMKAKFPYFTTFGNNGESWYEEDCDTLVVILAFPEYFDPVLVQRAFMIVNRDKYFMNARAGSYWNTLVTKHGKMPPGC